mgnify:CR=1 FL=1
MLIVRSFFKGKNVWGLLGLGFWLLTMGCGATLALPSGDREASQPTAAGGENPETQQPNRQPEKPAQKPPKPAPECKETKAEKKIGPEGGSLSLCGASLHIPKGGVSKNTLFRITRMKPFSKMTYPYGMKNGSDLYRFEPQGKGILTRVAEIRIPFWKKTQKIMLAQVLSKWSGFENYTMPEHHCQLTDKMMSGFIPELSTYLVIIDPKKYESGGGSGSFSGYFGKKLIKGSFKKGDKQGGTISREDEKNLYLQLSAITTPRVWEVHISFTIEKGKSYRTPQKVESIIEYHQHEPDYKVFTNKGIIQTHPMDIKVQEVSKGHYKGTLSGKLYWANGLLDMNTSIEVKDVKFELTPVATFTNQSRHCR